MNRYFKREEFACGCGCGFASVDYELLMILDTLRDTIDKPIVITSGCRCPEYNTDVGGSPRSKHRLGLAADFRVSKKDPDWKKATDELYDILLKAFPDKYGIARGNTFVHLDVAPGKARRWTY